MATTRRRFLAGTAQGAAVLAAPAWLAACATAARENAAGRRFGIQVYSLNQTFEANPADTLKQLREIGFTEVESYASTLPAAECRRMLDQAGLACPSSHVNFDSANLQAALDDANALGARYATSSALRAAVDPGIAWEAKFSPDEARRTAALANRIGEAARRAGLQYAYHNHAYEFDGLGDGTIGYDLLLRETDPALVKFEIDCGWMTFAGYKPQDYLAKHPGRFPMLHIKDYLAPVATSETSGRVPMAGAELGRGVVDYAPIFAAARQAGVQHYFAEQEGPFTRMSQLEAAKVAFGFLQGMQ